MTTSFACPLSIALVVSFVPLHVEPVCAAICRASYVASAISFGISNFM